MSLSWLDFAEEEAPSKEDVEPAKKVYQEIEETTRKLNVSSSRCTKVEDLFTSDILQIRYKIQNLCEALITNYSPCLYGFCAREKLWKHVYYDAVQRARKLVIKQEKPWSHLQLAYIKAHIETGIARFQFFVMKIQEAAELDSKPLIPHPTTLDSILNENTLAIQKSRIATDDDKQDQKKLVELLSMCYINMGDLYRYMKDIFAKSSSLLEEDGDSQYFHRAQEWYTQAFIINPSAGLSLNQLGNIYSDQGWGIDSTYYLLYSTLTETPYEGAFPNLRHMLDTRMVQFARRAALPEPRPIELLCNGFTGLLFQILFEETQINYEKFCQDVLANFHERLVTYDPDLDEKLLFKFATISVMVVWRLQSINSVHTSPAVAFAMSIFFTLVTQLGVILKEHSTIRKALESCHFPCDKDSDNVSIASRSSNNVNIKDSEKQVTVENPADQELERNPNCKAMKQRQSKHGGTCRGPRYRSSSIPSLKSLDSDQEVGDDSDEDDDSDYLWSESAGSDSEETDNEDDSADHRERYADIKDRDCANDPNVTIKAFMSSSSSNGRSEPSTSGSGNNSQKSIDGLQQELMEAFQKGKQTPVGEGILSSGEEERMSIEMENLLKCQTQIEPLLVALTPFIRWLQSSPAVKDALAANAEKIFLEKLCEILTTLTSKNWAAENVEGINDQCRNEDIKQELINDWEILLTSDDRENETGEMQSKRENLFQFELAEDRSMLGMPALRNFLHGLKITDQLTPQDQLTTRVGRLIGFGMWMTKTESFSMMYAVEDRRFFVPTPEKLKFHLRSSKMKRLLNGNGSDNLSRLTRAYQEMKIDNHERRNRDRGRRFRNRGDKDREDGKSYRRSRVGVGGYRAQHTRRHPDEKPICVIVDMDGVLKHMEIIKRLTCHKKFVVYLPHSVFEGLDMMKDSREEMSDVANDCYQWVDAAIKRNHPGIKVLRNLEKKKLPTEYPVGVNDIEMWEYFEMLECCNFLMGTVFEGNPYNYTHTAFGDQRDKYSVFFLSGNDTLLDTTMKRGFDPIKIARSLPGVYVDCINEYPPSGTRRPQSPRRGRKWQTSGKCKG